MLWMYGIIGGCTGLLTGIIFYLMTKNKVATSILAGVAIILAIAGTKKYIMPTYYAKAFEQSVIADSPFMELLAKSSPKEFKIYVEKVKQNILSHGNKSNEIYYASELINAVLVQYGPKASTDSLYRFLIANLELDKKLFEIDPQLVLALEFPAKFKDKADPTLLDVGSSTQALLDAKVAVISSGMQDPQPPLNEADTKHAAELINNVITDLSKKYGDKTVLTALTHPDDPSLESKVVAEIIISFYENVLARGKDDGALIIRFMFAHSAGGAQAAPAPAPTSETPAPEAPAASDNPSSE